MTPHCQTTFVVLLISVVNVDLLLTAVNFDGIGTLVHIKAIKS